ncbi:MAG: hypothetical protein EZS28_044858, partial [Streblomastix strix]
TAWSETFEFGIYDDDDDDDYYACVEFVYQFSLLLYLSGDFDCKDQDLVFAQILVLDLGADTVADEAGV